MKKILILASLLMGWSQIVIAQPGDAAAGEANSVVCSACHGADGNSAVASFPKLAGLGEKYLLKAIDGHSGRWPSNRDNGWSAG